MKYIAIGLLPFIMAGCASSTDWTPVIDPYNDHHRDRIAIDLQDCKQLALSASGGTAGNVGRGVAGGGLLGAATGAILGAISGNPASGAAYGAAAGGIGGGLSQGAGGDDQYRRAYANCLRNRGHNVVN